MLIPTGQHMSIAATVPDPVKAQQQSQNSAVSYLSPTKAQQHLRISMDQAIHDAANSPSSSKNNLLNSLVALKERDYQNVTGSKVVLKDDGGLLGGAGREDEKWPEWAKKNVQAGIDYYLDQKAKSQDSGQSSSNRQGDSMQRIVQERQKDIQKQIQDAKDVIDDWNKDRIKHDKY